MLFYKVWNGHAIQLRVQIDDMPAFEKKIVLRLCGSCEREDDRDEQSHKGRFYFRGRVSKFVRVCGNILLIFCFKQPIYKL